MRARSEVLETAILGILADSPLHGYELRKRLNMVLGSFRALSYGSLYPALRSLEQRALIAGTETKDAPPQHALSGRRSRIVYELTAHGKEHLQGLLSSSGPAAWEDESFDVRFALFGKTDAETRLRILEGRRTRLAERLEMVRESANRTRERLDEYTLELQRHGLEQVEHEVAWLDELIDTERGRARAPRSEARRAPGSTTQNEAEGDPRPGTTIKERG